jgi:hypothetical protein
LPGAYGTPSSIIFGDEDGDGFFDNTNDLLNLYVQKYGRTTGLTSGQISAINVFVEVCYEQFWGFCIKSAYFFDQIEISGSGFSGPGDSGSLIVTYDPEHPSNDKRPVGLLFAGSDTTTYANRIDFVLDRFGVTIDDGTGATPVAPAAPSNLIATPFNATEIDLAWTDNSNNEAGFKIERCQGAGCANFIQIATVGANVTSYSNTGLSASTTYVYRVRAYNAGGDSDYSYTASATTLTPPAAPSNLKATAVSRTQINLTWTDNSNNEQTFAIERCKGASCINFAHIANVGADVRTFSNTNLSRNTTYRYRVRAYNKAGYSGYSNIATAKTSR